jgi:hypothetical protein
MFRNVAVQCIIVGMYLSFAQKYSKMWRLRVKFVGKYTKWCDHRGAIYRIPYVVVVRLCVVGGVFHICGYRRGVLHTPQICHAVNVVVVRLYVVVCV